LDFASGIYPREVGVQEFPKCKLIGIGNGFHKRRIRSQQTSFLGEPR
jgi:hypothetical protein